MQFTNFLAENMSGYVDMTLKPVNKTTFQIDTAD